MAHLVQPKPGSEWCSPAGNCGLFIFQKSGAAFQLLLYAPVTKKLHILINSINGYHDIQTDGDGGGGYFGISIYQFDGKVYRLSSCFSKIYGLTVDSHGEIEVSNNPRVSRIACPA